MSDEITFLDLMALTNIKADTVVEKFGGLINSSFFDASNVLGALKIKGLIDFTTTFPGQSAITLTESGKRLIQDAGEKAKLPFDQIDMAILIQLSGGKRSFTDLSGAINLASPDMAMHLYKIAQQQYITPNFRNGMIDLMLTEKGYMAVNSNPEGQRATAEQKAEAATQAAAPPGGTAAPLGGAATAQLGGTAAAPIPLGKEAPQQAARHTAGQPAAGQQGSTNAAAMPELKDGLKAVEEAVRKKNKDRNITLVLLVVIIAIIIGILKVTGRI